MDPSTPKRKISSFENLFWLFFGGSFIGIALIAAAWQSHGWLTAVFATFASLAVSYAFEKHKRLTLVTASVFILVILIGILGQEGGKGLAILSTVGVYGPDHSNRDFLYAEKYLVIAVIWLLLGVPHRAFKYQLDRDGRGDAQRVVVRILVTGSLLLTGAYIFLLHFGNGPLRQVNIRVLIPGLVFTVFLVVPAYRSIAKACWQRGMRGLFSLKPLTKGWVGALAELDAAFSKVAEEFLARKNLEKVPGNTPRDNYASHKSESVPRSNRGGASLPQRNSKPDVNKALVGGISKKPAMKVGSTRGSDSLPLRKSRQRTKKIRGKKAVQRYRAEQQQVSGVAHDPQGSKRTTS